jgi:hypothetical protein
VSYFAAKINFVTPSCYMLKTAYQFYCALGYKLPQLAAATSSAAVQYISSVRTQLGCAAQSHSVHKSLPLQCKLQVAGSKDDTQLQQQ